MAVVWAAGPACATCYKRVLQSKQVCEGCGSLRRADPRVKGERRLCSDCAGLPAMGVCQGCGHEDRIWRNHHCFACNLADRLDFLLRGADGTAGPKVAALRSVLAATSSPRAVLRWLDNPTVAGALEGLASSKVPFTHEALDQMGTNRAVAHLRHVLVSTRALPERNETAASLEAWVDDQLERVDDPEDRRMVGAYASWWVVRRRRARLARRPTLSVGYDHEGILRAIELLSWLRAHDRSLATCTQADIDLWLASGPPGRREARRFVRWAGSHRLCGEVVIGPRREAVPVASTDVAEIIAIARRLMTDQTVALADRVAGLLLILYGQPRGHRAAVGHYPRRTARTPGPARTRACRHSPQPRRPGCQRQHVALPRRPSWPAPRR